MRFYPPLIFAARHLHQIASYPMPRLRPVVLAVCTAFLLPVSVYADDPVLVTAPPAVDGQVTVEADHIEGVVEQRLHAKGQVKIQRGQEQVEADWLDYYQNRQRVVAGDRVRIERNGDVLTGTTLDYVFDPAAEQGVLHQADIRVSERKLRADAAVARLYGQKRYGLEQARVTTCAPGNDDWYIRARQIDVDYQANVGVARDGVLEFHGVPILYSPYLDFPVNGNRKSGFLAPTFASRSDAGADFRLPYYFNLAPNYDLTLAPRILSRRGLMLGGEFRYLQPDYKGFISGEYLPDDQLSQQDRYALRFEHEQKLRSDLLFSARVNYASDDDYFRDFGNRASLADNVNLVREAVLTWLPEFGVGQLRIQRYQTLQDRMAKIDAPYSRLPQITFSTAQSLPYGFELSFNSEYVDFAHDTKQEGRRLTFQPSISLPLRTSYAHLIPKLSLNYRHYQLDRFQQQAARDKSFFTPTFSLDAGLQLEREATFFGDSAIQTLEPRLLYVRTPYRNQDMLPLFDTTENSFDFAQMFAENRFSGGDRLSDANTLTAALTTRFIDQNSGVERFRLGIGQRYVFSDQKVTLTGLPDERKRSDFLASVGGQIFRHTTLQATYQYNTELRKTERYAIDLRYQPAAGKTVSARYRYGRNELFFNTQTRDTLRQLDIAAQWPVARNWYVVARENYSLRDKRSLEHLLGVEYHADCWAIRAVGQRYVSGVNQSSNGVFLQLELNELGGLGSNPLETLRLAIPGYSKINEPEGLAP
ncbi:LPS-assembly protein LptD [Aquaspirillum serpens]|uniref:LPS-assembly protein LptD n=1 Tax=Aquaspirillum serpens TaxID=190 RepID=UPI0003B45E41|nr:LPS-assembly protein LptD [Aquaspirillum serpens]